MRAILDEQLIAGYLAGDKEALEILIKRYFKRIYGFAYRYAGNSQDAEDITQEVFVKAWRNLKKFNPQRSRFAILRGKQNNSFKIWIFHIAKNTSLDLLKKKKAIPFSNFEAEEGENFFTGALADPAPLPSELLERADIALVLNSAVEKLPSKYHMVLFLHYNDCFTFREIAEILGEPLHTVKSRHRRALIQLRKLLPEY